MANAPKKPVSNRPMPSTHRRAPTAAGEPPSVAPPPPMPSTHRTKPLAPVAVVDDGTRYRVRDKDFATVWGQDLSKVDAEKLKNEVVSSNRSRTARLEPMSAPTPETDPQLAQLQVAARAASAKAAAEANARQAERARRFQPLPDAEQIAATSDTLIEGVDESEELPLTEDELAAMTDDLGEIPTLEEVAAVDQRASLVAAGVATEADLAAMTDKDVAELAASMP